MRQSHTVLLALLAGTVLAAPRVAEAGCPAMKEVEYRGKMQKQPAVGKVERTLGGKIFTSDSSFPYAEGKTAQQYISAIKGRNKTKFWENKAKKEWRIYFAAFYTRPLDDLEVTIRLVDITGGGSRQIASFPVDLDPPPCETSFLSDVRLDRESFGVNKKILMVIENRKMGKMATTTFEILGEAEKFSGKADFSDEDTREPGQKPPPPPDPDPDPPPEKDPELDKPIEYKDTPNLNPEEGFQEPPDQHKANRGCGCRAEGGDAAGGLLLLAAVALVLRRRRR